MSGLGVGVQQSPTSERPYQRVILLVDAGVAMSRRYWSVRDARAWRRRSGGVVATLATITRRQPGFARRQESSMAATPATPRRRQASSPSPAAAASTTTTTITTTTSTGSPQRRRAGVALLPSARTHSRGSRSICPGEHFRSRKFDRPINRSVSGSF